MRLPREISVLLPRDLASDELTIQLRLSDSAGLENSLKVLAEKREDFARVMAILNGTDEV